MGSAPNENRMILRSTLTSPFGRKVRMAIHVLGLAGNVEVEPADTLDPSDSLRSQNPLGKMPVLVLGSGTILYDSRTILEYLDAINSEGRLYPVEPLERARIRTAEALGDGITDAALLMVYEGRFRDPESWSQRWLNHQEGKIIRALAALEAAPPDPERTDAASISTVCALSYLDWRKPVVWRDVHPRLVAWLDRMTAREPAVDATANPEVRSK